MLNLTQHHKTSEQEVIVEPESQIKERIRALLTFEELPSKEEIEARAEALAEICESLNFGCALIGGAPYLMSALERALIKKEISPFYSFTKRVSEEILENGTLKKVSLFKHIGYVDPYP